MTNGIQKKEQIVALATFKIEIKKPSFFKSL